MRRLALVLLLFAAPAWAADSISAVNEGDTADCSVAFTDQNGVAVNPDTFTRKVTAAEDGTVLIAATTVSTPGTTWTGICLTTAATTRTTSARPGATMTRKIEAAYTWGSRTKTKEWTVPITLHSYPPPTPVP